MFSKKLNKISRYFFYDIFKKIKINYYPLKKVLNFANINEDVYTYLSSITFISFFIFFVLEVLMIFLMINLNIYFSFLSFLITIFISFVFGFIIFLVLLKYPYFIVSYKRKEIDRELNLSINHLSVLKNENLTVIDVLHFLRDLEGNVVLSKEVKKILKIRDLNNNVKSTLRLISKETYSDLEKDFFTKLIDVLDQKEDLSKILTDFFTNLEQSRKEMSEQKKSRINLLFQVNIFLFFFVIILLLSIFLVINDQQQIKQMLNFIAIIFPIIEFILIIILYK